MSTPTPSSDPSARYEGPTDQHGTPPRRTIGVRDLLTRPAILRALAVAGVAVVSAVVVAAIACALVLLGVLLQGLISGGSSGAPSPLPSLLPSTGSGNGSASDVDVEGVPLLAGLFLVLGSMFFGIARGDATLDAGEASPLSLLGLDHAAAHFSAYLPMIGLLIPVVLLTVFTAWRLAPATPTRLGARLVESALAAVAAAVALEVIALIGTSSITVSGVRIEFSTAGWSVFAGGLLVVLCASLAGGGLATRSGSRTVRRFVGDLVALPRTLPGAVGAPLLVVTVWAGCFAAAASVGLVVTAVSEKNLVVAFAGPVLLGTATLLAAGIGQLGAVSMTTTTTIGARSPSGTTTDVSVVAGSAWAWSALLVAVVATLLAAVLLRRLRPAEERRPVWLLPALAIVAWLLLPPVLGAARGDARVDILASTITASASVLLQPWVCLLGGVWGLAVEALARWVIPAWTERTAPASARIRLLSLVAGGGLVVLGVVAAGATLVINGLFSPAGAANDYLEAIARGDTKVAAAVGSPGSVLPLPTDARDRISDVRTERVSVSGDSAIVSVSYSLAGRRVQKELKVARRGSTGIFPKWVVTAPLVTPIRVEAISAAMTVGGQKLTGEELSALPGIYSARMQKEAAKYVAVSPARVVVRGDTTTTITQEPKAALEEEIAGRVHDRLTNCAASEDLEPAGCPFSVYSFNDYRDVRWNIDEDPTVDVTGGTDWSTSGGNVSVTYEEKEFFGDSYSKHSASGTPGSLYGTVTITAGGVIVSED